MDSPDRGVSGGDGGTHTVSGGQGNVQHAKKSHGMWEEKIIHTGIILKITQRNTFRGNILRANSSLQLSQLYLL